MYIFKVLLSTTLIMLGLAGLVASTCGLIVTSGGDVFALGVISIFMGAVLAFGAYWLFRRLWK